jgi:DNA-binding response OmpR family regulator
LPASGLCSGAAPRPAPVVSYGSLAFDTVGRTAPWTGDRSRCQYTRSGCSKCCCNRFGRVVSKEQLVEQLYNYDKGVTPQRDRGVRASRAQEDRRRGLVVRTLYGRGYLLDLEREAEAAQAGNRGLPQRARARSQQLAVPNGFVM